MKFRAHRLLLGGAVLYCFVLHVFWAAIVFIYPEAIGATPVSALYGVFRSDALLCIVLVSASALGLAALFTNLPWVVVLLIPQQSLLLISAAGAIASVVTAQFADGVIRPRAFIAVDQMHIVLAAIGHAAAIIVDAHDVLRPEDE